MPGFRNSFNDAQVTALARYLRARYATEPAWSGLDDEVRKVREGQGGS
jgi:hypothetical protein